MGGVRQPQTCAAAAGAAPAPCEAAALQEQQLSRHGAGPRCRVFSPHLCQALRVLPAAGALARVVVSRDVAARARERGLVRHIRAAGKACALACQMPDAQVHGGCTVKCVTGYLQ
jgi:hypothetical protein